MSTKEIRRAKLARTLGIGLALAGLVPIAWFVAASLYRLPMQRLPWIAQPAALLFALASLALMWLGAAIVARQNAVFEAHRRETQDRLRRVREYGTDGRIEPYIGSDISLYDEDKEPRWNSGTEPQLRRRQSPD